MIVDVPIPMPVTVLPLTVATVVLLLVQLRAPDAVSANAVVPPTHNTPIPVIGVGDTFTVIGYVV